VFDLFLRGFAPKAIKRVFSARLARYEMQDMDPDVAMNDVPIASGCFMLVRRAAWRGVGGFEPTYFLYFEDFDLSVRIRTIGRIAYVPSMRIVHHGGGAAGKGWRHVGLFVRAARLFFNRHGWRWY
jgi:GT2 family glycosyltransferase